MQFKFNLSSFLKIRFSFFEMAIIWYALLLFVIHYIHTYSTWTVLIKILLQCYFKNENKLGWMIWSIKLHTICHQCTLKLRSYCHYSALSPEYADKQYIIHAIHMLWREYIRVVNEYSECSPFRYSHKSSAIQQLIRVSLLQWLHSVFKKKIDLCKRIQLKIKNWLSLFSRKRHVQVSITCKIGLWNACWWWCWYFC